MFTGIIKETGIIETIQSIQSGVELMVRISAELGADVEVKSNLAIDGQVFTVVKKQDDGESCLLYFYLSNPRQLQIYHAQKKVNLERAIRAGEEIPGALFYGNPSGTAQLVALQQIASDKWQMEVAWDNLLLSYLDVKEQVCVDGVLLIIKQIVGSSIFFNLYGDTLKLTNLGDIQRGDWLKIEVEPMVKKIAKIFENVKRRNSEK